MLGRVVPVCHPLHEQVQELLQLKLEMLPQRREGQQRQPQHQRKKRQALRLAHLLVMAYKLQCVRFGRDEKEETPDSHNIAFAGIT